MKSIKMLKTLNNLKRISKISLLKLKIQAFSTAVQPWIEIENRLAKTRGELVLAEESQINAYALNLVKSYFRTTNKQALKIDSALKDHGLDSLDSLELCVQLEDELGYIIEAETMPKFSKVSHFINFITHMEAYKRENKVLPQVKAVSPEGNWDNYMPMGETIKNKLYDLTKEKDKESKH